MLPDSAEQMPQRGERLLGGYISSRFFGNNVDIPVASELMAIASKILPYDALNPIANDGIADFAGNCDAQARAVKPIGTKCHDKTAVVYTAAMPGQEKKFRAFQQLVPLLKTIAARMHQTVRRLRPLALRLLMTRLPCLVAIRFKKPCVLALLILLG